MAEERMMLNKYAMRFGTAMGLFWIFKFIFFALGPNCPFFFVIFPLLTLAVPFLGYYYIHTYRNKICGGFISFSHAWSFTFLLYSYAALLTAVAHYVYFHFIGTDSLMLYYTNQMINPLLSSGNAEQIALGKQLNEIIKTFQEANLPAIQITMHFITQNIFYCSLLSIPTALIARKSDTQSYQ